MRASTHTSPHRSPQGEFVGIHTDNVDLHFTPCLDTICSAVDGGDTERADADGFQVFRLANTQLCWVKEIQMEVHMRI